jgi:hypothetical protein
VKLAKPERPVVTLIGDGGFLYNPVLQSFGASRDFNLPILVVIFNNRKYAAMQNMHKRMYPEGVAVETGKYFGTIHQWSGLREGDRGVRRLQGASRNRTDKSWLVWKSMEATVCVAAIYLSFARFWPFAR